MSTKERILDATAVLLQRQGYTGTGLKQIVSEANAPFGSVYHFFPDGKEQLGEEVIRRSGQLYVRLIDAVFGAAPDVVTGVRDFFAGAAETVRETDYADACPIATVALEVASTNERLRRATADVFASWLMATAAHFTAAGIPEPRARELAITAFTLLEGAFLLSRASRSTEAIAIAGRVASSLVEAALATPPPDAAAPIT